MLALIGQEIRKTYLKWRSYISFIAIGVVVPLVIVAIDLQGEKMARGMLRGLSGDFLLLGNLVNGYFATLMIMNSLWIHIPFLITLGAGDQLAGEATGGTFRILLIRPASRTRIFFAKYCTTLIYVLSLVAFLAALSLGLGVALLGTGDLVVAGRVLTIIPKAEALARIGLAFALALWGMWTVASLAFFFSTFVENAIGPIVGTMAVLIVFYVVGNIPLDLFAALKPVLFTSYLDLWLKATARPIPWTEVGTSLAVLGGYSAGLVLATWAVFVRKDVLS